MKNKTRVKKKISKPTKSCVKKNQRIFIVFGICLGLFLLILFLNSKYFSKTKTNLPPNTNEIKTETESEITPTVTQQPTPTIEQVFQIQKISSNLNKYINSTHGFSLIYPSDWTIDTKIDTYNNQIFFTSGPKNDYFGIYFYKNYKDSLTNNMPLEEYLSVKWNFPRFNKTKIGNINCYIADANGMSPDPYPTYFVIKGNDLFEISSDDQDFSQTEKQIINTFTFN